MLRDVVGTFLDTLTEREFDGPLLALLAARGFTDVHFIHGGFEFGKDVVAKKADADTGEVRQYVIQSKAGDIGLQSGVPCVPSSTSASTTPSVTRRSTRHFREWRFW